jgi:Glyoxalase-like domain
MAYEFQVAVDCADPHTLADWWAETLGWQIEDPQCRGTPWYGRICFGYDASRRAID